MELRRCSWALAASLSKPAIKETAGRAVPRVQVPSQPPDPCEPGEEGDCPPAHIRVAVRVRPLPPGEDGIIEVAGKAAIAVRKEAATDGNEFLSSQRGRTEERIFDRVFGPETTQAEVYEWSCKPLVASALEEGRNATIFVYGATGTGKTHTMFGEKEEAQQGLISRAIRDAFGIVAARHSFYADHRPLEAKVTFLDIYNETVRDLLCEGGAICKVLEDERRGFVKVTNIREVAVSTAEEALRQLRIGLQARKVEATAANARSSRSHAVFSLTLEHVSTPTSGPGNPIFQRKGAEVRRLHSRICLIDLAGSERANKTQNMGSALQDGAKINQSLLALANCIDALTNRPGTRSGPLTARKKPPFRDSKLTLLLKGSLTSDCLVSMIANIHPGRDHFEDSNNTLEYAKRASVVKKPVLVRKRASSLPSYRHPSESTPPSPSTSSDCEPDGLQSDTGVPTYGCPATPELTPDTSAKLSMPPRTARRELATSSLTPRGFASDGSSSAIPAPRMTSSSARRPRTEHRANYEAHTAPLPTASAWPSRIDEVPSCQPSPQVARSCGHSSRHSRSFRASTGRRSESPPSSESSAFSTAQGSETMSLVHLQDTILGTPRVPSSTSKQDMSGKQDRRSPGHVVSPLEIGSSEAKRKGHPRKIQKLDLRVHDEGSSTRPERRQQQADSVASESSEEGGPVIAASNARPQERIVPRPEEALSSSSGHEVEDPVPFVKAAVSKKSKDGTGILLKIIETLKEEKGVLDMKLAAMRKDRDRLEGDNAKLRATNLEKDRQMARLLTSLHGQDRTTSSAPTPARCRRSSHVIRAQ